MSGDLWLVYMIKFARDPEPRKFRWKRVDIMISELQRLLYERGEIEWIQLLREER